MPFTTDPQEKILNQGIVQTCIVARNLPEDVTIPKLTQLFDAVGLVANIKILDGTTGSPSAPPSSTPSSASTSSSQTAIIAYYSEETAMRAIQELDGNMALGLSNPISMEYIGPSGIKEAELELKKREQAVKDAQVNTEELQKILDSVNLA